MGTTKTLRLSGPITLSCLAAYHYIAWGSVPSGPDHKSPRRGQSPVRTLSLIKLLVAAVMDEPIAAILEALPSCNPHRSSGHLHSGPFEEHCRKSRGAHLNTARGVWLDENYRWQSCWEHQSVELKKTQLTLIHTALGSRVKGTISASVFVMWAHKRLTHIHNRPMICKSKW